MRAAVVSSLRTIEEGSNSNSPCSVRISSARMAVKQRRAQRILKRADLAADRRLRQVQHVAGMGQAAGIRDGVKYS